MIARSHRIWRLNRDWSNNYGEWKKRPYTVCLAKVTREDLFLLPRSIWFRNYGAPMELVSSKSHDNKRGCVAQSLFRTLLNHSLSLDLILVASRSRTRYDPLWSNLNHLIIANVDDLCFLPYYCSLWIPPVAEILLKYWRHIRWVSKRLGNLIATERNEWVVQRENCEFIRSLLVSHPIHPSRVHQGGRRGWQEMAFYSVRIKLMTQCQSMSSHLLRKDRQQIEFVHSILIFLETKLFAVGGEWWFISRIGRIWQITTSCVSRYNNPIFNCRDNPV